MKKYISPTVKAECVKVEKGFAWSNPNNVPENSIDLTLEYESEVFEESFDAD